MQFGGNVGRFVKNNVLLGDLCLC